MSKICTKCGSLNCEYNKIKMVGKNGLTFHIRLDCKDCKGKKYVPRSKEAYEDTKNKVWLFTDKYYKKLKSEEKRASYKSRINSFGFTA